MYRENVLQYSSKSGNFQIQIYRKMKYRNMKQKMLGFAMLVLGLLTSAVLMDGTAGMFLVPAGGYLIASKERIVEE